MVGSPVFLFGVSGYFAEGVIISCFLGEGIAPEVESKEQTQGMRASRLETSALHCRRDFFLEKVHTVLTGITV